MGKHDSKLRTPARTTVRYPSDEPRPGVIFRAISPDDEGLQGYIAGNVLPHT